MREMEELKLTMLFSVLSFMLFAPCILSVEARKNIKVEYVFIVLTALSVVAFFVSLITYIILTPNP